MGLSRTTTTAAARAVELLGVVELGVGLAVLELDELGRGELVGLDADGSGVGVGEGLALAPLDVPGSPIEVGAPMRMTRPVGVAPAWRASGDGVAVELADAPAAGGLCVPPASGSTLPGTRLARSTNRPSAAAVRHERAIGSECSRITCAWPGSAGTAPRSRPRERPP